VELAEIEAEPITTRYSPKTARRLISHRNILIARSPKGILRAMDAKLAPLGARSFGAVIVHASHYD
jgi:hypothetical protein